MKKYENISNNYSEVLTSNQLNSLYKRLYPKNTNLKDKIHYFDSNDLYPMFANQVYTNSLRFIVAYNKRDILGICKIAYYSMNEHYAISYLSVHKDYFNRGISKLIIEELFRYFSHTYPNEKLHLSGYSIEGWKFLHKRFVEMSNKYDVKLIEKPIEYVTNWTDENRELFNKSREEINRLYGTEYYIYQ